MSRKPKAKLVPSTNPSRLLIPVLSGVKLAWLHMHDEEKEKRGAEKKAATDLTGARLDFFPITDTGQCV